MKIRDDKANRLKSATTSQGTGNYSTSYIYDKNGNLINLNRFGKIEGEFNYGYIDKLIYYYTGNKLKCLNDWYDDDCQNNGFSDNGSFSTTTSEYTYDANGNMLSDQNKDLDTIVYNYVNLPQQINFSEGYQEINYLYTANGQKLMKQSRTENAREHTVDYLGNFVYENGQLRYILTEEGRALAKSNGAFEYQYFLKDHLGNTRITFNQNGQIIQEDAYYPFGMAMNGLCYQSGVDYENKYLYNGKELQDDFGLDWYDYGARMYDAVIGRWHVIDPLTENHYDFTPYNYVLNNPLSYVDTKGMDTLRVSSSFKMTTGKFGLKGKVFGAVGYGLEYCFGGAEQEVELYLEVDTDTWDINIGAKHTQRYIEKGSNSAALGIFHGGVSEEKEIVNDINIKEGSSRTEDKKYEKKESGGIGPVTTEETKEGITVKGDMGVGGEINALIFGVGAGVSVDYIPTKSTPQKEDKERK